MIRLLPLAVFLLLVLLVTARLLAPDSHQSHYSPMVGHHLPDFSIDKLNAPPPQAFTSAQWHGKLALINVFASWCEQCKLEHPLLVKLAQETHIPLYGIGWRDTPEKISAYLAERGNPYESVGITSSPDITALLGLTGVPETMLVDKDGIVRGKFPEPLSVDMIENELLPMMRLYNEDH